jgi:hypothetical protein
MRPLVRPLWDYRPGVMEHLHHAALGRLPPVLSYAMARTGAAPRAALRAPSTRNGAHARVRDGMRAVER